MKFTLEILVVLTGLTLGALLAGGQTPPRKIKILMLGDSLTHYGLAPACEKALNANHAAAAAWTTVDAGIGGETAERGKGRIAELLQKEHPDVVTVGYGANDIAHRVKPEQFRKNMEGIIALIQAEKPAPRIVLLTVTPVDPNRHSFGKDKYLMDQGGPDWVLETQYNAITRALAAEKGLGLADMHRVAMAAPDPMQLLQRDGIHLTPEAYTLIGGHVAGALAGYCQTELLKDPNAVKARAAAQAKLGEIRKQLEKGGNPKAQSKALDEVWQACPYLADAAVLWHRVTYPTTTSRPATTRGSN